MKHKDLNAHTAGDFIGRIENVEKDTPRQWGMMTAAQMCAHMSLSIEGGLGEVEFEDRSNLLIKLARPILFSGIVPFPKGRAQTAPEYAADDQADFATEHARLIDAIYRFIAWCDDEPDATAPHPYFGTLNVSQCQRGHGLHLEHHLKQFGV